MKKRIGIIGAGRFGMSLAESMTNAGMEVVLVDRNRPAMQSASEFATAVQGDATQPHVLEEAGFGECDVVVVAIGSNIEASMMATANCKELGVETVIAKASSELHGKILRRIGADSVVYPDRDSAHRLARAIANHDVVDFLEVSEGYSIAEIDVPDDVRGKTLGRIEEVRIRPTGSGNEAISLSAVAIESRVLSVRRRRSIIAGDSPLLSAALRSSALAARSSARRSVSIFAQRAIQSFFFWPSTAAKRRDAAFAFSAVWRQ